MRCGEPDDHNIEYVFLDRESWLIDKARRADKLTLGITFYQEGVRYFTFDIAGLDASKIGIGKPAKSSGVLPTPVARPALPATASAE